MIDSGIMAVTLRARWRCTVCENPCNTWQALAAKISLSTRESCPDRELPGCNRNKLEHGLWQLSWVYTKQSTVCQEGFFHPYVNTEGPLRARTIGTSPADLTTNKVPILVVINSRHECAHTLHHATMHTECKFR
ncbi:TPA: hypothetical protein ACH3X2_000428 [Trebouxia sp. C0005]